jgi:hypothetical protein
MDIMEPQCAVPVTFYSMFRKQQRLNSRDFCSREPNFMAQNKLNKRRINLTNWLPVPVTSFAYSRSINQHYARLCVCVFRVMRKCSLTAGTGQ